LAKISPTEDSDFTKEKFEETYNADLANGLGNLVSRVAKLCEKLESDFEPSSPKLFPEVESAINEFRFDIALKFIWDKISLIDQDINKTEPWKLEGQELKKELQKYLIKIREIALNLEPFLPDTSQKILTNIGSKRPISEILFPRI
jgi:methionyl-tRNA synthetase